MFQMKMMNYQMTQAHQAEMAMSWLCHFNVLTQWQHVQVIFKEVVIHWTEVISSHYTIFSPIQKVIIAFPKVKFYKKVQGFGETLQIMSFQNDW